MTSSYLVTQKLKIIPILVQLGILCCTGQLTTLLPLILIEQ